VTTERRAGRTRRPRHSYSPEVADLIYERLAADGASLRQICQDRDMPARSTVFLWLRQRPEFREQYTLAKQFQIQWLADEMVDIADGRAECEGSNGQTIRVSENFRRQQIAALHSRISKLKPKRYHW
jgi:transposase-like protein